MFDSVDGNSSCASFVDLGNSMLAGLRKTTLFGLRLGARPGRQTGRTGCRRLSRERQLAVSRAGPIGVGEKGEAAPTTGRRPRHVSPRIAGSKDSALRAYVECWASTGPSRHCISLHVTASVQQGNPSNHDWATSAAFTACAACPVARAVMLRIGLLPS